MHLRAARSQQPGPNFQSGFDAVTRHLVDIDAVAKSNHALCVCDLICLPVSSVGQRETRSCSEYTTLAFSLCRVVAERRRLQCVCGAFTVHVTTARVHVRHCCCPAVAHTLCFVCRDYPGQTGCQAESDPRVQQWVSVRLTQLYLLSPLCWTHILWFRLI